MSLRFIFLFFFLGSICLFNTDSTDALNLKEGAQKELKDKHHLIAENKTHHIKIYNVPPSDFNPKYFIAACYSRFKNKYLLLHRAKTV